MDLKYPAIFKAADEGGFVVTFPDVPEAITQGDDEEDARLRAAEALETALEFYTEEGQDLPRPSAPRRGQRLISPPALASAKLAVYQTMREQGVRKAELARRLGWHAPQIDRLLDLRHASRLEHVEAALAKMGRHLGISVTQ